MVWCISGMNGESLEALDDAVLAGSSALQDAYMEMLGSMAADASAAATASSGASVGVGVGTAAAAAAELLPGHSRSSSGTSHSGSGSASGYGSLNSHNSQSQHSRQSSTGESGHFRSDVESKQPSLDCRSFDSS